MFWVTGLYSYIPIKTVVSFIEMCDQYVSRKVFSKPVRVKRIISVGFMTRIQMDPVDMGSAEHLSELIFQ